MHKCSYFRANECIFALLVAVSHKCMIAYFLVMNTKRCNVLMHWTFYYKSDQILYTKSETNIREGKKKVFVEFLSVN